MARLDSLPDPDTIKKLRGQIDYAVWRGVPYARKWPEYHAYKVTPAMQAQIATYSDWLRTVHETAPQLVSAAKAQTKGTNWTWRDLLCRLSSGNAFES